MKKAYEKPVILRLESGYLNKFGSSPMYARKVRKDIDGATIDDLVEEFGSPLFVFSERKIREKYRDVHEAFATRYPNVVQAWSYKTNYLQAICAIFHDEGALAEVVSEPRSTLTTWTRSTTWSRSHRSWDGRFPSACA
jgi:diaminopimelate decarboxylase